jgi:ribosomal protein S6 kinase alpha-5
MLCGRAPFHSNSREGNAAAVMQRIKTGDFDFDGEAWKHVSSKAKNVIQGEIYKIASDDQVTATKKEKLLT